MRFAAQLGFDIEAETKEAMVKLAPDIAKVSAERIQTELVKLITSAHPGEIRTAWETGLTAVFLPEFDRMMATPAEYKASLLFGRGAHGGSAGTYCGR